MVLERKTDLGHGTARNVMRGLDDSMLVSAEECLPKFLPFLQDCPYRLVVKGTEIQGIVTLSDVAKLPVRLMAFTLVTHLEMLMARVIREKYQTDADFLAQLHPRQRPTVNGRLKSRKKENLLISALDLSDTRPQNNCRRKDRRVNSLPGTTQAHRRAEKQFGSCFGFPGSLRKRECIPARALNWQSIGLKSWVPSCRQG